MSVVVGFSFPEEAIIISDSRISFVKGKAIVDSKDNLRKIFALTPQLAIGFTSDNVEITHKIISELEKYIAGKAKVDVVYYLLKKLPETKNKTLEQIERELTVKK